MTEKYIFNGDAAEIFYEKLDILHERYVYHLLLSGAAPKGTDIESVKMTKNPDVSRKYCEKVVGGLVNIKPNIVVTLEEDKEIKLQCIFTQITDANLFMIQNVMDWPQLGKFSCQVWYLGQTTTYQIKEIWD